MGVLISSIRNSSLALRSLFTELHASNTAFNRLLERISTSTSLPVSNSTASFWFRQPLFPDLTNIKSDILPDTADVVILGSGITGASIARTLLSHGQDLKVVMLEARQVTSGATGRNGGHIKASPCELYPRLRKRFGHDRAVKIVEFQTGHLELLLDLGIEASEARKVETVDLYMDSLAWDEALESLRTLRDGMPDAAKEVHVWEGEEAREKFQVSSYVHGAMSYPAGALWPYRLVTSILSTLLKSHFTFKVETHTPATAITTTSDATYPYTVSTPRGTIKARHIIHATNGYASTLLPGLRGKIFPVRGQMTAQRPGQDFPKLSGTRSWSLLSKNKTSLEYMIQRPPPTNSSSGLGDELLLGGALFQAGGRGLDEIGEGDDSKLNLYIGAYLGGVLPMLFAPWGADDAAGRVKDAWTGIMGFTVDALPFVGRLDDEWTGRPLSISVQKESAVEKMTVQPGEWISAGYNGEGMVNAWGCGIAVALMVLGKDCESVSGEPGSPEGKVMDWLPEEYLLTKKRLERASIYELGDLI